MKKIEINKLCKGCFILRMCDENQQPLHTGCNIAKSKNEGLCPCINCLVKTMCRSGCYVYRSFERICYYRIHGHDM
jgi:hypothetical protein